MSDRLKEFLRKTMTIPYKHRGRGYDGADCGGGILIFYRDFLGIELPDYDIDYDENWSIGSDKSLFLEHYYKFFEKVSRPQKFDIVLFQTLKGIANHGGIVLDNAKFWHISKAGAGINRYSDEGFHRRLNGFYRYKKTL